MGEFFGRPEGQRFADDPDAATLLRYWLDAQSGRGFGDPLVVSSRRIEDFLLGWAFDWPPVGDVGLARLPALLEAFVPVAHQRREVSPHLTAQVLATLHQLTPRYLEMLMPADTWPGYGYGLDDRLDPETIARRWLIDEVGGPDQLANLDATPLPLEQLDLTAVPTDLHDRLRIIDAFCAGPAAVCSATRR